MNSKCIGVLDSRFSREIVCHFDLQSTDSSFEEMQIHIEVLLRLARKDNTDGFLRDSFIAKQINELFSYVYLLDYDSPRQ